MYFVKYVNTQNENLNEKVQTFLKNTSIIFKKKVNKKSLIFN